MNKLLEVKDLTVAFELNGELKNAVNHISFDLYEKDFVGLVGESGCGKTVATQTVLGIQSLDAHIVSGSCKLKDREVLNMSEEEWNLDCYELIICAKGNIFDSYILLFAKKDTRF